MKSKFTKTVDLKITFTILVGLVTKFVELTKFTHHYHSLHKDTGSFLFLFFFCRDRGHARPAPVNSSPPPPWPRGTAPRPRQPTTPVSLLSPHPVYKLRSRPHATVSHGRAPLALAVCAMVGHGRDRNGRSQEVGAPGHEHMPLLQAHRSRPHSTRGRSPHCRSVRMSPPPASGHHCLKHA